MNGGIRIKDLPNHERPRERLLEQGAEALRDSELIAILLRTGSQGRSAIQTAEEMLARWKTLEGLARAPLEELWKVKGIGRAKAVTLKSAFTLAGRMAKELQREAPVLDTPEAVAELLHDQLRSYEVEFFHAVLLNTRRKVIEVEQISRGLVDSILVHPREVFRRAIAANASFIVLAHNHPSGDPTPSEADIRVTRELIRAGQLLRIEVVDHIIFGKRTDQNPQGYISLRQLGYFAG